MYWIKIRYRLLLFYRALMLKLGLKNYMLKNQYGERILVFHGIDKSGETRFNSRFISKDYFEQLIAFLVSNYNVISLDDYYQKKFKSNTLNIALTFDDGYSNNYKYAIPILKKHGAPATFFITTIHERKICLWPDFIDLITFHTQRKSLTFGNTLFIKKKNSFTHNGTTLKNFAKKLSFEKIEDLLDILEDDWQNLPSKTLQDYWKLMKLSDIKEISRNPLFTIGAHGETHADLSNITFDEAKKELRNCKAILENICGHPIEEFAFPFGSYTKSLAAYCLDVGYKKILIMDYNAKTDLQNSAIRSRFVINPHISFNLQLISIVKGYYY